MQFELFNNEEVNHGRINRGLIIKPESLDADVMGQRFSSEIAWAELSQNKFINIQ